MIVLFTDFGVGDPYVGQVHGVLARAAPGVPVVDLWHAVPAFDIRAAACLLPAYTAGFGADTVFLCVVDPGVGSARRALAIHADGCWYVGPDNGLFTHVVRRARHVTCHEITWRPAALSASFHGRDLFAPAAAALARGTPVAMQACDCAQVGNRDWPDDLAQVLFVDHYGNAVTGLRAAGIVPGARLCVGGTPVSRARVFAEADPGSVFWYENSNGLVEFAANRASAAALLRLAPGDPVEVRD